MARKRQMYLLPGLRVMMMKKHPVGCTLIEKGRKIKSSSILKTLLSKEERKRQGLLSRKEIMAASLFSQSKQWTPGGKSIMMVIERGRAYCLGRRSWHASLFSQSKQWTPAGKSILMVIGLFIDNEVAYRQQRMVLYGQLGSEALQKVNMLPIYNRFDLNSMKRVLDGASVKDNEEALMKMEMYSRELKKGESF